MYLLVILVCDSRIVSKHFFHRSLGYRISTSPVGEQVFADHGRNSQQACRARVYHSESIDQVRPRDVRVRIDKDVPVVVRAQPVALLGHVDVLVLVEVPARRVRRVEDLGAVVLVHGAFLLQTVEIEVGVVRHGRGQDRVQAVPDVVAPDVLLEVGEDQEVGQTLEDGHDLDGQPVVGLGRAGLHDEQDPRRVGKAFAHGIRGRPQRCLRVIFAAGRIGLFGWQKHCRGRGCGLGVSLGHGHGRCRSCRSCV